MIDPDANKLWLCNWWYADRSACGLFPKILTNSEKELLELAEKTFRGFNVLVEFVCVAHPDAKPTVYREDEVTNG